MWRILLISILFHVEHYFTDYWFVSRGTFAF